MKHRSSKLEILDVRTLSPDEVESTFRFIAFINSFGSARATRSELRRLSRSWRGPIRILDVASGGADVPRAVARWARRSGLDVSIVCLELSPGTIDFARRRSRDFPSISFVRGDARRLPFPARSFDYVICSLFLHHLGDDDAVGMLSEFDRLASRGIVVCDLIRRRRGFLWAWFLTLFGNSFVHHDGPLSVKRAFTLREMRRALAAADIGWAGVRPTFGHHFVISGERPGGLLQSSR